MLNKLKKLNYLLNWFLLKCRRNVSAQGLGLIENGVEILLEKKSKLIIGKGVQVRRGTVLAVSSGGELTLGNNIFIAHGVTIAAKQKIVIGESTMLAEYVSVRDHDHEIALSRKPLVSRGSKTKPVTIGKNVWIGAKATIVKGLEIGNEAVIGANAVVTHNIPKQAIAAGVPTKIIGKKK
jgi:acetyltransferase-like isoleucine patch superfamily enzyme